MSHILYCWEMGGALGHIVPFSRVAAELIAQGHKVTCVVTDLSHAPRLLEKHGVAWLPAPRLPAGPQNFRPLNHADIFHGVGYDSPERLYALLTAWRQLLALLRPDRVICEYAPTAGLAAKTMNYPVVCLDTGFYMPPISDPMPPLRENEAAGIELLRASEQRTLGVINQAMKRLHKNELGQFGDLFDHEVWYPNWCEFNHFGPHSPEKHLGQIFGDSGGADPVWPKGEGPRAFAYIKPGHVNSEAVLDAAVAQGYRLLAYLPGFPAHALDRLRQSGRVIVSDTPVRLGELDDGVDIGIWHSPTGSVGRCLDKGMRMLYLPLHAEQERACSAVLRAGLPAHVSVQAEDWPTVFEKLRAMPVKRFGERWQPADVSHIATLLAKDAGNASERSRVVQQRNSEENSAPGNIQTPQESTWLCITRQGVEQARLAPEKNWLDRPDAIIVRLDEHEMHLLDPAAFNRLKASLGDGPLLHFLIVRKPQPDLGVENAEPVRSFACSAALYRQVLQVRQAQSLALDVYEVAAAVLNDLPGLPGIRCLQMPLAGHSSNTFFHGGPSVEWIMPHQGNLNYLDKCLKSVRRTAAPTDLMSVCFDEEVTVDHEAFIHARPECRFFTTSPNRNGPYVGRDLLGAATCQSVIFHQDSDDLACDDRRACLLQAMLSRGLDLVGSHELRVDEIERKVIPVRFPAQVKPESLMPLYRHPLLHPTSAINAEAFRRAGGFSTIRTFGSDSEFLYRALPRMKIGNVDEFLYVRRLRMNSLSTALATVLGSPERVRLLQEWSRDFELVTQGKMRQEDASFRVQHRADRASIVLKKLL